MAKPVRASNYGGPIQLPLFEPACAWTPPALVDLPSWQGAKRVSFDCETKDPQLKILGANARRPESYMCGFSFAIEDGPKFYVPIRHEGGDNVDADQALDYLREQAANFEGEVVGMNLSYDIDHCYEENIEFKRLKRFRDIMIADPLINELNDRYSMQAIAERWGVPGKSTGALERAAAIYNVDPKGGMWRLPGRFVGEYGEQDAAVPLDLLRRQERKIDDEDLWDIYNLESDLLPVLVRMRRRGIAVDFDRLEKVENWSLDEEAAALREVHHLTGVKIAVGDVWAAEPLARALEAIGYTVPKTPKGAPSITKDILQALDHPVTRALSKARKVNKIRTTFAQSVRTYQVNGRIHCTFNQLRQSKDEANEDSDSKGGRFGRLSCSDPNLQQQPSRDDEWADFTGVAELWRSIYVPDEGEFISADYSQQEPRWLTHYAELTGMPRAAEAASRYRDNPDTDNHTMMTELVYGDLSGMDKDAFKRRRGQCKELFLGKCYAMGGAKLCRKLKLPTRWAVFFRDRSQQTYHTEERSEAMEYALEHGGRAFEVAGEEGQQIIDKFDKELPYVSKLAKKCEERAKEKGFIVTVLGRRCRMPQLPDGSFDWCHKALNRLIQGSSGDQTKRALVDADRAGLPLQLQVHDEINMSGTIEMARELAHIMATCVPANLPFKVDIEMGPSWGEAKELKEAA